ncbi:hypothetical protein Tco_0998259, partial [Tanacetum coccineum]
IDDQPLPDDASPTALSPGYVANSNLEEDPEEDPAEYPVDGGDDDDDDEEDEEEDEHLALADFTALHTVDLSPQLRIQRHLRWTSLYPHHHHPNLTGLGYPFDPRHRFQLLLRHSSLNDVLKADMPLQKRARFTAPTGRFEVGESSSATVVAREAGHNLAYRVDYGFIDTIDASIWAAKSRVMTVMGVVNERVTDLVTTQRQKTHKFQAWVHSESRSQAIKAQIRALQRDVDRHDLRMDQLMLVVAVSIVPFVSYPV